MAIKSQMCLLLSICVAITSMTMAQQDLYGVWREGKFYKRSPPTSTSDDWIASATLIGTSGWNGFQHLFFHPDGTLYGVLNGKFYKGPPPTYASDNWIGRATLVGTGGWDAFQFLFFDPYGMLYGVIDDKLYRRAPPTHSQDNWLGSATQVGKSGWSTFKFLFFSADGFLWAVYSKQSPTTPGDFLRGPPPTDENDEWARRARRVGFQHFADFQILFFMRDGYLYGIWLDGLWKKPPTLSYNGDWTQVGTSNWSDFKFLMAPLLHV